MVNSFKHCKNSVCSSFINKMLLDRVLQIVENMTSLSSSDGLCTRIHIFYLILILIHLCSIVNSFCAFRFLTFEQNAFTHAFP